MPPEISEDLKLRMVHWHDVEGLTQQSVAERAGCSIGLVSKVLKYHREYGTVKNPFAQRSGRPRLLSDDDLSYVAELHHSNPTIYLDEVADKLWRMRDIEVSLPTICRALDLLHLSRKQVSKQALERSKELRALWEMDMAQYTDPNMFVALDESAIDNKTVQRTHGRAIEGQPCVLRETFLRGIRYSLLPALTTNGIVALDIFEGSVTKERFIRFLEEKVCPLLNPFPAERSIVILDNCSIHHDEDIRRIIEDECGARLIYLPPYSPDFNPIEEAFSAIKKWLRRHEHFFQSAEDMPWLIHEAAASVTADMAWGWFSDCGYVP